MEGFWRGSAIFQMISRMRVLIHPRWWLTKLFSLLQPYGVCSIRPGGDGGLRRSSPLRGSPPFSGANAGSTLRPRPGLHHMYSLVSVKTFSTHVVIIFRPVVRGKRFSTHGNRRPRAKLQFALPFSKFDNLQNLR